MLYYEKIENKTENEILLRIPYELEKNKRIFIIILIINIT